MDISPACQPPRRPLITAADRAHPLFPEYQTYLRSCNRLLIECPAFADWLTNRELQARRDAAAAHPRFPEFQTWMRDHKGGARRCPAGDAFPANFTYWLAGGRW